MTSEDANLNGTTDGRAGDAQDIAAPVAEEVAQTDRIIQLPIETEMKRSFLDYSMSVITARAIPDVRDGLKPVHRRILYGMNEMGLSHDKPYKKSARVVGDVLGKYHPHGDTAVYDSMVRMAQDFSLRYMLVEGQGNFGSVDGDSAAAMRYTEARMSKIAKDLMQDIEKETVEWTDNFDGSLKEPTVMPAKVPNLLINGSSGIAVGMATNIPPHNLREIADAISYMIRKPDAEVGELMEFVKGPDFPTGGIIYGRGGIWNAYASGRGHIYVRARTHVEEKKDHKRLIITEIPYMVNKSSLIEAIADLVREKRIEGLSDLRDESDKEGMRIVIELKRDAMEEVVLNTLFKHTQMQATFGVISIALVDRQPKLLTLRDMIAYYIAHRFEVITRRTRYDLDKAEARAHILAGLMVALENIDRAIEMIKKSGDAKEAAAALSEAFGLDEDQVKAILDMRLQKLTSLEVQGIRDETEELRLAIERYYQILGDEAEVNRIIDEEILDLRERFGDERKTEIVEADIDIDMEDLIPKEDVVVIITKEGYIKRIPLDTYRTQKRGGKGLTGMGTKEDDVVVDLFVTGTHDYIMFLTNRGRCYWLKGYRLPEGGRHAKGKPMVNLLPQLENGEKVNATIPISDFTDDRFLVFATRNGIIKKTVLSAYGNVRQTGIIAINLDPGDELIATRLSNGEQEIILATEKGQACRFNEHEVRVIGRVGRGVRGITLREGDHVVAMTVAEEGANILTITENGYGKLTPVGEYRKTHRGGSGVKTIMTNERNGKVVSVRAVKGDEQLMLTTDGGMVVRMPVKGIRIQGRATMGVIIMRLAEGDKVVAVEHMMIDDDDEVADDLPSVGPSE